MTNLGHRCFPICGNISEGFLEWDAREKVGTHRLAKLLKRDIFVGEGKRAPSGWSSIMESRQSTEPTKFICHIPSLSKRQGTRFSSISSRDSILHEIFVGKTKLLILSFKIRSLSVFFKEQRKEKSLKHTTQTPKAGPLNSPTFQEESVTRTSKACHTMLSLPIKSRPGNPRWQLRHLSTDRRGLEPGEAVAGSPSAVSTTGKETKTLTSSAAESL